MSAEHVTGALDPLLGVTGTGFPSQWRCGRGRKGESPDEGGQMFQAERPNAEPRGGQEPGTLRD